MTNVASSPSTGGNAPAATATIDAAGVARAVADGHRCLQAGDAAGARDAVRRIEMHVSQNADAEHLAGLIEYQSGRFAEAAVHLSQAVVLKPDFALAHNHRGAALGRLEQAEQAADCFRRAIEIDPQLPDAHYNLANVLRGQGELEAAREGLLTAIRFRPTYVEAHFNLANVLRDLGRLDEAAAEYRQALAVRPHYVKALNNLGNVLLKQRRPSDAEECFRRAIAVRPNYAEGFFNLARACGDLERHREAVDFYRRALELDPAHAEASFRMGVVFQEQADYEAAVAGYRQAIARRPLYPEALNNLGNCLLTQKRYAEAEEAFAQVLAVQPDNSRTRNNLGALWMSRGDVTRAEAEFRRAFELDPEYAEPLANLATALQEQGSFAAAIECYERALAIEPELSDALWNRTLLRLRLADFGRGWPGYEQRWRRPDFCRQQFRLPPAAADLITENAPRRPLPRRATQPAWDGAPIAGQTMLLFAEQGLGDTLQFVRYARHVQELGTRVIVECQRPLVPLLAGCDGIDVLVGQGDELPPFDLQAPLMSLPRVFQSATDSIPAPAAYLRADAALETTWRDRLRPIEGFRIGIAWQGNPAYFTDRTRSIPLVHFARVAQVSGVRLVSLQRGSGTEQVAGLADRFAVMTLGDDVDRTRGAFVDTAAVIRNLDLVITSDTAIAHLAGALGARVWVVLPHVADWRWLVDREDSLWYPTMRLFRQTTPGDWDDVFRRVAGELRRIVTQGS